MSCCRSPSACAAMPATIADSLSRSAIDAPPMFSGAVPNVFANTTRARVPRDRRSHDLRAVSGCSASPAAAQVGLPAPRGSRLEPPPALLAQAGHAGRATTAVVHVATQWSDDFAWPNGDAVTSVITGERSPEPVA